MDDDAHNIFTGPPDGLGEKEFYFGTFVPGMGSMVNVEVARAFAEAADRLMETAAAQQESWEAAYPILFCYRHALELYLKSLLPERAQGHRLNDLVKSLKPYLDSRYPADQVSWLTERIAEFDRIDPKSTVFRYPDGPATSYKSGEDPWPETWVDFRRLQRVTTRIFNALEWLRLHRMDTGEPRQEERQRWIWD